MQKFVKNEISEMWPPSKKIAQFGNIDPYKYVNPHGIINITDSTYIDTCHTPTPRIFEKSHQKIKKNTKDATDEISPNIA